MSSHSKIKQGASRRNADKAADRQASSIEPHAELRDQQGRLLAGIVRSEGEWVLGLGGRIAGSSASAAHPLAMIKRAARLHEAHGTRVRLEFSNALKSAAEEEAAGQGTTLEEFEARLAAEMDAAQKAKDTDSGD